MIYLGLVLFPDRVNAALKSALPKTSARSRLVNGISTAFGGPQSKRGSPPVASFLQLAYKSPDLPLFCPCVKFLSIYESNGTRGPVASSGDNIAKPAIAMFWIKTPFVWESKGNRSRALITYSAVTGRFFYCDEATILAAHAVSMSLSLR